VDAFCVVCSRRLAEGVKFCGECGAPVAGSAELSLLTSPDRTTPEMQSSLHREIGDPEMIDSDKKLRLSAALIVFGCVVLAPAVVGVIFSVILIFAARHAVEIDLAGGILFGLISCVGGLLLWFLFVSITSRKNGPGWDDK